MKISKIRFAYFSPIKLTQKIAYNAVMPLSRGIVTEQYNLTSVTERQRQHSYAPDELLVAAIPSYGGRIPQMQPPLLANLHGQQSPAVLIVNYGNRGYDDVLVEMESMLRAQGFVTIAAAAFVSVHAMAPALGAGRPGPADLKQAQQFGMQIRQKLEDMQSLPQSSISLPGNIPFKPLPPPIPFSPVTNEKCVLCMQCFRWCPTDAIPYNDPNKTDADKCILCHGCIRRCPVDARQVVDEPFIERVRQLEASFAGNNCQVETFL